MIDAELDQVRHNGALLRSLVSRQVKLEKSGRDWKGLCPFHTEKTPSFTVFEDGHFHCFGCNAHGTSFDYVMQTERIEFREAVKRIEAETGTAAPAPKPNGNGTGLGNGKDHAETWQSIVPPPADASKPDPSTKHQKPKPGPIVGKPYDYHDAAGGLIFQVTRHAPTPDEPKPFRQRRPDGKGGWIGNLDGVERVLYRLPSLLAAPKSTMRYLCEGEKDADRLAEQLLVATTNPMGAGNFKAEQTRYLAGCHVALLIDNDEAGEKRAVEVPKLLAGIVRSVRIIRLPGLGHGEDVSNWLDRGGTAEELERLTREAPEYRPAPEPELREDNPSEDSFLFSPRGHELPQIQPRLYRASEWADRIVPPMRWTVEDWIPRQQVTGLYGIGGSLKTWFLLQGLMAKAAGLVFLGRQLQPGPTLGLFCEDTAEEVVRRKEKIAAFYGRPMSDFHDFHWVSLVGVEDTELVTFEGQKMERSHLLLWLDYTIKRLGISLVGLDTLAHMFGGEEIRRRDVARFIRQLDAISIARDCALLFTAQPSVRGKTTGTMESGSTHWEAGVRSRLTWHDPAVVEESAIEDADPDVVRRVLTRVKSNYAQPGETMELIWRDRLAFFPAAVAAEAAQQRGPLRAVMTEDRFLDLLAKIEAQGDYVHNTSNNPSHYAPGVFSKRPDGKPFSKPEYARAMAGLFAAGKLRMEPFGAPSRGKRKLVATQR